MIKENNSGEVENTHYKALIYKTIFAGIIGLPLLIFGMLNKMPPLNTSLGHQLNLGLCLLTFLTLAYSGGHFFIGAWKALCVHRATMDTLIALGTGVAWLYSLIAILFTAQ